MDEHLKEAETCLNAAAELLNRSRQNDGVTSAIWQHQWALRQLHQHLHLESQKSPETPGSETSSAPTTGPAEKPSPSCGVSLVSSPRSLVLTEVTSAGSRSIVFTPQESEVMPGRYLSLPRIHAWLMQSGKSADGSRGPASPDPSSSASAGGESEDWPRHQFVETVVGGPAPATYPMRCQTCGKHYSDPSHEEQS